MTAPGGAGRAGSALNEWLVQRPGVAMLTALRRVLRHPKLALALLGAGLVLGSARLADSRMLLSIGDMLDKDSPSYRHLALIRDQFPAGNPLTVAFFRPSGAALTDGQLCGIERWMWDRDLHSGETRHVQSPFHYRVGAFDAQARILQYPTLLTLDCWQKGRTTGPADQVRRLAQTPLANIFVAPGGAALLVNIDLRDTPRRNPYGTFDPTPVKAFDDSLKAAFGGEPDLTYSLQGGAAFKWHFLAGMTHDQGLNLAIAALLVGLFRLLYGTWRGGFLLLGTLLVTFWLLTGLMTLTDTPFDILANSLFVMIALAATEDFLYLSHMRQAAGGGWRRHFARLVLPSFYTSLTTFVGFGSLCISDIAPIRRLGLWAAIGAMIEWAVVFYALPAVMALVPRLREWTRPAVPLVASAAGRVAAVRLPRLAVRGLLAVMVLACAGFGFLQSNDSVDSMWPPSHPFSVGLARLGQSFGWRGDLELLLPKAMSEAQQGEVLARVAALAGVRAVENPYALLAAAAAPVADPAIRRIVDEELRLADNFKRYFAADHSYTRTFLYLNAIDITAIRRLEREVDGLCGQAGCIVAGEIEYLARFSSDVIVTLINSFLLSLALVGFGLLLLAQALGSRQKAMLVLASLWGPVVLIGFVPLLLGGVNFVTCVSASVLVAMAGDNCIQFLFAARRTGELVRGVDDAKEASVRVMVMMSLCALVFLASDFKQPKLLGPLFATGYLCLLIGDVWLLRGLLSIPARAPEPGGTGGATRRLEPDAA